MSYEKLAEYLKNKTICYYPSSGLDIRDIFYFGLNDFVLNRDSFANELVFFEKVPDVFVHSDFAYDSNNWPIDQTGIIFQDQEAVYSVKKIEKLISSNKEIGRLLEVEIDYTQLDICISRSLIFLFDNNFNVISNLFFKHRLNIEFLISIRDGSNQNGGANSNIRYLEFFLANISCKYFITDNMGRTPDLLSIEDESTLKSQLGIEHYMHYLLRGLKEWEWSENGIFAGDAHLYEVYPSVVSKNS